MFATTILPFCYKAKAGCLSLFLKGILSPMLLKMGSGVSNRLFGNNLLGSLISDVGVSGLMIYLISSLSKSSNKCPEGDTECEERAKQEQASIDLLTLSAAAYGMSTGGPLSNISSNWKPSFDDSIQSILSRIRSPFYSAMAAWAPSNMSDWKARAASTVLLGRLFSYFEKNIPQEYKAFSTLLLLGSHLAMIRRAAQNISKSNKAPALEPSSELVDISKRD